MSKVMSAQGQVVDFEMMKIMGDINAPKNKTAQKKVPKFYEIEEVEIPYIESISPEELLREQLAKIPKPEEKVVPLPLIIQEPIVETSIEPVVEIVEELPIILESSTIEDSKENIDHKRRNK